MRTVFFSILMLAITAVLFSACKNNKDELLNPPSNCDTADVRYSSSVVRILQANCYGCHREATNAGGPNLDNYTQVAQQAANGKLLGTISHASGFIPMPRGSARLSDCDIATIRIWVQAGYPNN